MIRERGREREKTERRRGLYQRLCAHLHTAGVPDEGVFSASPKLIQGSGIRVSQHNDISFDIL